MTTRRYRAAVIGCGRIGGFLDSPRDRRVFTHAHAYRTVPGFRLAACCDPSPGALRRFRNRWGRSIRPYSDYRELLEREPLEVLSICTDTPSHARILEAALAKPGLRAILCEKPLVETLGEFRQVSRARAAHPDKKVFLNFSRRYDPSFARLERFVREGRYGVPLRFGASFNKGLYHNGCHVFELVERLFGRLRSVSAVDCRARQGDFFGEFHVEADRCSGSFSAVAGLDCSFFELDILLSEGRLRVLEGGLRLEAYRRARSRLYPGYFELRREHVWGGTLLHSTAALLRRVSAALHGDPSGRAVASHWPLSGRLLLLREALKAGRRRIDFIRSAS